MRVRVLASIAASSLASVLVACSADPNVDNFRGLYASKHDAGGNVATNAGGGADPGDGSGANNPSGSNGGGSTPSAPGTPDSNDGGAQTPNPTPTNDGGAANPNPVGSDAGPANYIQYCVDGVNKYRAQIGLAPYGRASDLDAFSAAAAQSDSQSGQPHGYFQQTNGGNVAFAENELPGWPVANYTGMEDLIDQGLAAMWNEGPGGGHYENMASQQYSSASCGFAVTQDGNEWVALDFK